MKTLRLTKQIKSLSPKEELQVGAALNAAKEGVGYICAYLEQKIISIDKELSNTSTLYSKPSPDRYVAVLLAKREANFKLLNLLRDEVTLDDDQSED